MSNIKSMYIHIPFCKNICTYCDFCKVFYNKKWIMNYLEVLENEIRDNYNGEILETIYIGGGTPSSLDINELKYLFKIIKNIKLSHNYEFTIECNIEDITEEKLLLFKNNRINRLSIGIQSFSDKILKYLGRNYNSKIIDEKLRLAKNYFNNINIDLIYAVNNETIEDLNKDIDKFLLYDISHISCYSLIIEENTVLYNNKVKYIDEDLDRLMYDLICKKLKCKYNHYEISNFAKEGFLSKHNLCYWNNNEYYGFGVSAASYINDTRYLNTKNLTSYLNGNIIKDSEVLNKNDKLKYELILGFRKINGINKNEFYNKYNIDIKSVYNIKDLIDKKILKENKENIYIDENFIYVSNDILINFI